MGLNLFNHQSGVKLPKWKSNIALFVDYKLPVIAMKFLIGFLFVFAIAFRVSVIICAGYVIYLIFR